MVSARYPLINEPGSDAGEVVLEGTYVATTEPITLRNRFRYARSAQIIGTLVYTELEVTWTTFQVGDYDVSGRSPASDSGARPATACSSHTAWSRAGPDLFGPPIAAKQCPQRTRRLMCRDVVD